MSTRAIFDNIFIITRSPEITVLHCVLDGICACRSNCLAVVHLECGDLDASVVVHNSIAFKFLDQHTNSIRPEFFVFHPDLNIVGIGLLQVRHQHIGAAWTDYAQWRLPHSKVRL